MYSFVSQFLCQTLFIYILYYRQFCYFLFVFMDGSLKIHENSFVIYFTPFSFQTLIIFLLLYTKKFDFRQNGLTDHNTSPFNSKSYGANIVWIYYLIFPVNKLFRNLGFSLSLKYLEYSSSLELLVIIWVTFDLYATDQKFGINNLGVFLWN